MMGSDNCIKYPTHFAYYKNCSFYENHVNINIGANFSLFCDDVSKCSSNGGLTDTAEECRSKCEEYPGCSWFGWVPANDDDEGCWLYDKTTMSDVFQVAYRRGAVSGFLFQECK